MAKKFFLNNAGIAQLVEHDLAKVGVASSSLVSRSTQKVSGFRLTAITKDPETFKFQDIQFFKMSSIAKAKEDEALVVELVDTQDLKSCGQ